MATTGIQTGVPQLNSPMVLSNGMVSQPWYLFFLNIWARTGGSQQNTTEGFITGEIKPFAGPTIPPNTLLCDGTAYSRAVFSNLFNAIGTTWGAGDGSTTFNVPNFSGRTLLGSGGPIVLGALGGSATTSLTIANLAAHSHPILDPGHTHAITDPGHVHSITDPGHHHTSRTADSSNTTGTDPGSTVVGNTGTSTTGITGTNSATTGISNNANVTGITTSSSGSGSAFSILPPYAGINYIIIT